MNDLRMITLDDVRAAAATIQGRAVRTPTVLSSGLSRHFGVPTTLKLELLQHAGSFKSRGALAKMLAISEVERSAGVAAVSGGNHGVAVAEAAHELDVAATIVMTSTAPRRSIERCRALGADVRLTDGMAAAFALVDELAAQGRTLIHPFDDPTVIAAQGTVGLELITDAPEVTDVVVSIGGGGLISGIAAAVRGLRPDVRVWGVETAGADAMSLALTAGHPVATTPTSIVTTLSAPHVSTLTFAHVRELVSEVLVVSDADAVRGTLTLAESGKLWAEPAAGCLVPAAHQILDRVGSDAHLALVVCGGNMTWADCAAWVAEFGATPIPDRQR